jgi:polysaccharide biosynthesis/export protein
MKRRFLYKKIFFTVLISGLILILASGCVSRRKTILFQKTAHDTIVDIQLPPKYLVQGGDILFIKVQSLDEKAAAFISGNMDESNTNAFNLSEQFLYFNGYEVTPNGMIHLPYLDSLKVSNMTTDQIASMITDSLTPFIKEALITVKLGSFRVSVFGEVQNSGTFLFHRTRASIFEAIAMAKPTEYYNATNVVITRQSSDNRIRIARVDLTSPKILKSSYYFLQPNDQIYIEPLKVKKYGFNTFPYTLILSTLSTLMIIYTFFK